MPDRVGAVPTLMLLVDWDAAELVAPGVADVADPDDPELQPVASRRPANPTATILARRSMSHLSSLPGGQAVRKCGQAVRKSPKLPSNFCATLTHLPGPVKGGRRS